MGYHSTRPVEVDGQSQPTRASTPTQTAHLRSRSITNQKLIWTSDDQKPRPEVMLTRLSDIHRNEKTRQEKARTLRSALCLVEGRLGLEVDAGRDLAAARASACRPDGRRVAVGVAVDRVGDLTEGRSAD